MNGMLVKEVWWRKEGAVGRETPLSKPWADMLLLGLGEVKLFLC
jgi:hypothetical protein